MLKRKECDKCGSVCTFYEDKGTEHYLPLRSWDTLEYIVMIALMAEGITFTKAAEMLNRTVEKVKYEDYPAFMQSKEAKNLPDWSAAMYREELEGL